MIKEKEVSLLASIKVDKEIKTLKYSLKNKLLVFMDTENSLGAIPLDLNTFTQDA